MRRFIVLEGADNVGKSTLVKELSARLGMKLRPRIERIDDAEKLLAAVKDEFTQAKEENLILDRTYFISDTIYEPIFSGAVSSLRPKQKSLIEYLNDNAIVFHITCTEEELMHRYDINGDALYELDQILKAKRRYDDFFDNSGIYHATIDTTDKSVEESINQMLDSIDYVNACDAQQESFISEAVCSLDPNNINVAAILPTPYIEMTPKENTFHMCLWQVLKESQTYMNFFKDKVKKGHFVLMDNGQAEGAAPSIEELMPIYDELQPSEAVLPDIINNYPETIKRTKRAYDALVEAGYHRKMQFMAVPQGENFEAWYQCLEEMLALPNITSIGVSKFCTSKYQEEMGPTANVRLECVHAILQCATKLGRDVQIHLLGCHEAVTEITEINLVFRGKVRSTDSGIAFVYTRNNLVIRGTNSRPDQEEIDFIKPWPHPLDYGLLVVNCKLWRDACQMDTYEIAKSDNLEV